MDANIANTAAIPFHEEPSETEASTVAQPSEVQGIQVVHGGLKPFRWKNDVWDLPAIAKAYSLRIDPVIKSKHVSFKGIQCSAYRMLLKEYLIERLLTGTLSIGTVQSYKATLEVFFNTVSSIHPDWQDLKGLQRTDIESYFDALDEQSIEASTFNTKIGSVRTMLADLQVLEDPRAPDKSAFVLIRDDDYKRVTRKEEIDYVPPCVVEQIFKNFDDLDPQLQLVFLTGYKTGLRIGDVLALTPENIVSVGGREYIVHEVQKNGVEDHFVPIDKELATALHAKIEANACSYIKSCPYIFFNQYGRRMGQHLSRYDVNVGINNFIERNNIRDANGNIFHFHFHQLRHTYGIELLRSGVDLRTIQDLYAHASAKTSRRYARMLGIDKRKAFELALEKGCFDFESTTAKNAFNTAVSGDGDSGVENILASSEVELVEVPFGVCVAPPWERCGYASQPSCLMAHNGSICRDLLVGVLESDVEKYEIQIQAADKLAEIASMCGREDISDINKSKADVMRGIHAEILKGNIVSGDVDRLKRRLNRNGRN